MEGTFAGISNVRTVSDTAAISHFATLVLLDSKYAAVHKTFGINIDVWSISM